MIQNSNIFIIVPAYNEEKKITEVLSNLTNNYKNIVVVDDASQDETTNIVKKFPVTLLEHKINRGQGATLETGNQYAFNNGADIIVHFDADGQFLVSEIKNLIKPILHEGYDVVLGSRFLDKESNMPLIKKNILFPIARLVNKLFFNINLSDPQNGFRVFNKRVAKIIKIEQDGAAHCSEFLHKIFKKNFKIKEIPITVHYDEFGQGIFKGKGRGTGGLKILKDLLIKKIIK